MSERERAWGTRWANLDGGTTAHYWLGNEGTACGKDFARSIFQAYADDPRCQRCLAYAPTPTTTERPAAEAVGESEERDG